eukprot:TRINITY_DN12903_c0_g2_i2.p1 TRINITY_DN12903_c0_g2~~TRINITY_DN12903_c0_g2_i2.p1  ORF type:complete len:382 (-),score=101.96 TRINITY_DN12903_c0_g2_i2:34-1179(-)
MCIRDRVSTQSTWEETQKYAHLMGLMIGTMFFVSFSNYALGFWVGSKFIEGKVYNPSTQGDYNVGDVLIVFFSVITGTGRFAQLTPCLKAFATGKMEAKKIFAIIDSEPEIIIDDPKGIKPETIKGSIELRDVKFAYPSRTEVEILKGINIQLNPGKKYAFVGSSGCGKTTVMQLIERFYDVDSGEVLIDGKNIKDYNLRHLRSHMGYVGQEPVLFNSSIRENLLLGNNQATEEEILEALRKAKAYEFVMEQEKKLDTIVGTGGAKLSGGQKQRIAIARAILRNPSILLLDEATSALDRTNEAAIQSTLEDVSVGKTTIFVAHRLTTIRNVDVIFMLENGVVVEQGSHFELLEKQGKYYQLVKSQTPVSYTHLTLPTIYSV